MNQYNNSYFLTQIAKSLNDNTDNKESTLSNLVEFMKINNYSQFENFTKLNSIIGELIDLQSITLKKCINIIDIENLVNQINALVEDINGENNQQLKHYDYIQEKLITIVNQVNGKVDKPNKPITCVIFYESAERELQNAYLLKAELNRRGHEVYIYGKGYLKKTNQILDFVPDVVLVNNLYNNAQLGYYKSRFKQKISRIVDLQYEQILSYKWEETGHHNPKGLARNAIHLCWGEECRNRIISHGLPEENAIITGSLNVDMDKERFESIYRSKAEMAEIYKLDSKKDWILLISSFSGASPTEGRYNGYIRLMGENDGKKFMDICEISRKEILEWVEKYINDNDCEFIYRLHPAESKDLGLRDFAKRNKNFHLIKDDSIRSWLRVCDKINTWYSTSIIDAYFMNQNCSILRPISIPKYFDVSIMRNATYLTTYDEFCEYNKSNNDKKFPIDPSEILSYYNVDENKYAYEKICDLLEEIVRKNLKMELY